MKESLDTYLLWHFDFSYRKDNSMNLLSTGQEEGVLTTSSAQLSSQTANQLDAEQVLSLGWMDRVDINGMIIYFEF